MACKFNIYIEGLPTIGVLTNLILYSYWRIPREIALLDDLRTFNVGMNYLHGPLPSEIGLLGNLNNLGIEFNKLTGTIPSELENIANLSEY